jgi:hypothetical protein
MSCDPNIYFVKYRKALIKYDYRNRLNIHKILKYVIDLLITIDTTDKEIFKMVKKLLTEYKQINKIIK